MIFGGETNRLFLLALVLGTSALLGGTTDLLATVLALLACISSSVSIPHKLFSSPS